MKKIRVLSIIFSLFVLFFVSGTSRILAQEQTFTAEQLSQYTGKNGAKAYFAYEGKVYDVTGSVTWKLGEHFGLQAGRDLTGKMDGAPHGEEVLTSFPPVGIYISEGTVPSPVSVGTQEQSGDSKKSESKHWYDAPIRIAGFSLLAWSGLILGIVFVLNFLTCFALPWGKMQLPWSGSRPGPDSLDAAPVRKNYASIHKYFAWATILFGIIHGVLGLMQMFFKMFV